MAYTTINKSSDYFNTKLYTGNGSSNAITGVGFKPDWVWIKDRQDSHNHNVFDAVRGVTKRIFTDIPDAESTNAQSLKSFDSDGFTLGTQSNVNQSGHINVSWNWKANNYGSGYGDNNTDGSITSNTSKSVTAGFSIVRYTGNGTANATVGHGLGVEPAMILFKRTDSSNNWIVYQKTMGTGHYLTLNTTSAKDSASGAWCTPSSTLIQLNQVFGATNTNSATYIAYCFAEKQGYSKFGSYTGNGNANGTFIYTGFKPAFILAKRTDASAGWVLFDNKRIGYNGGNYWLDPQNAEADQTDATGMFDQLSNGFKIRSSFGSRNASGGTYIYMAFAEAPLVGTNNVPANAR